MSVGFYAGSQLIGTSTITPYSAVWSNMSSGTYYLTANAQDDKGLTVTSSPVTVKISKALKSVGNGRKRISTIQSSLNSSGFSIESSQGSAQMDSLVTDIQQAYMDFVSEETMFATADQLDKYLYAALYLSRSSDALAKQSTPSSGIVDRMNKIDAYLSFCEDLMTSGLISQSNLTKASRVNASPNLTITQPVTGAAASLLMMLSPNLTAKVTATASTPLSSQTVSSNGGLYELGDVSVTFNGQAALVRSVSPTQVTFTVPGIVTSGLADVLVTSRDGFIAHGTGVVIGLNPQIFAPFGDTSGSGAIVTATNFVSDAFSTTSPDLLGLDNRTRLAILASGISSGLSNTNLSNDIWLSNGRILANLADLVSVEARTSDGRVFNLPVEYAGAQGDVTGLDQVNVVLVPELANAGTVQLTIVAGGKRSNSMTIVVQ